MMILEIFDVYLQEQEKLPGVLRQTSSQPPLLVAHSFISSQWDFNPVC